MILHNLIRAAALLLAVVFASGCDRVEERRPLVRQGESGAQTGRPPFLAALPDGSVVYADTNARDLRWRSAKGRILEFSEPRTRTPESDRMYRASTSEEERRKLYQDEPVLLTLTNMKSHAEKAVLLHGFPPGGSGDVRIVQYLDSRLKVVRVWEEQIPLRQRPRVEPFAVDETGRALLLGEKGEILVYSAEGRVEERLVIAGVFNDSRVVEPAPVTEGEKKYMTKQTVELLERNAATWAEFFTKRLRERDAALPPPIRFTGDFVPPSIQDLVIAQDGRLILLDGEGNLYAVDRNTRRVDRIEIEGWRMKGDREKTYQLRAAGGYVFALTGFRLLQVALAPNPKFVWETRLPEGIGGPIAAWDVVAPASAAKRRQSEESPIRALFADPNRGQLHEVVVPTGSGQ